MAREFATEIAMAASMGFLTTEQSPNSFSNRWLITIKGLEYLHESY